MLQSCPLRFDLVIVILVQTVYKHAVIDLGRDFMDLLLSPASKVLNNWFEVVI